MRPRRQSAPFCQRVGNVEPQHRAKDHARSSTWHSSLNRAVYRLLVKIIAARLRLCNPLSRFRRCEARGLRFWVGRAPGGSHWPIRSPTSHMSAWCWSMMSFEASRSRRTPGRTWPPRSLSPCPLYRQSAPRGPRSASAASPVIAAASFVRASIRFRSSRLVLGPGTWASSRSSAFLRDSSWFGLWDLGLGVCDCPSAPYSRELRVRPRIDHRFPVPISMIFVASFSTKYRSCETKISVPP